MADETRTVDHGHTLSRSERQQLLYTWNNTQTAFPRNDCIHHLFEAQVDETPDAIAVQFESGQLTYAELNARANQLAHALRELGVRPDAPVAVYVERSLEMVVALLGILKAGGAYVPLDPGYPVERLRFMLEDASPAALLAQHNLKGLLPGSGARLPILDPTVALPAWRSQPDTNPVRQAVGLAPNHLAYVIYTSGSTGKPKGVMVEHAAVVNFLRSMQQKLGIGPADTSLAVTSVGLDIAALEIFLPLIAGAKLVLLNRVASLDGKRLLAQLQHGMTLMQATPATWRMLLEAGWTGTPGLTALCRAEALSLDLAQSLLARSNCAWNMYGHTETTIWSVIKPLDREANTSSIGRPIANTQVYILDARGEPVPIGVTGDLYIGGVGIARGYLKRPELTARKFLHNPFAPEPDARMYRTGDLGRWLPDGNIELLGHNDSAPEASAFAPDANAYAVPEYEPPQGRIETALAAIWAELLQLDRVGRHDNFFNLGGDSLLVMRVVVRVQEVLPLEAKITDFFLHPVLADLALNLDGVARAEPMRVTRATRKQPPVTSAPPLITATGANGHKIASRDNGATWYDVETGKVIE